MELAFLFIFAVLSVCGLYIAGLSAFWYIRSAPATGEVIGFQKKKKFGRALPVVTFQDQDDVAVKAGALRLDHVGYIISGAEEGNEIPIRYKKDNPKIVRISGLLYFIVGGAMQVPLLTYLVQAYGGAVMETRFGFILTVMVVLGVSWVVLRLVRVNY